MAMTGRQGWADRLRSVSFSLRNELFTPSIHLYVFYFFTQPFDAMLQYAFKITKLLSLPCSFIGLKILNHLLSLSWKLHPRLRVLRNTLQLRKGFWETFTEWEEEELDAEEEDRRRRRKMEEEGILLMGSLYRQQVEIEERKVEKEGDEEMDNADSAAYPREVLDMLASLYNASRRNDGVEKEEGKVVRNSRKLNREENLAIWEEENDEEEDDEEEVEVLEDMLGQMYNTSQGMTKALFRVVEEGRVERKKEEEMVEMCFEEEERVYQVIYFCFIEYPF